MAVSAARRRRAPALEEGFFAEKGTLSWALSLDHKRIALLQLGGLGVAFLVGGVAALLLHAEQLRPGTAFLDPGTYARTFTLHGAVMMFLFLVPGIPATLGTFVLPLQIGARNVAFPRLNLAALHLWLVGALLFVVTMHQGGADTGWTLLVPLSSEAPPAAGFTALAIIALAVASVFRAVVLMATLHALRAEGVTWRRTTPLAWSLYAHSALTLVAAPVLILTLVLLLAERSFGVGLFDPALGGDPLLFQHFFWFGAHACAYAAILPAIGVATEIIGAFARGGLFGRRSILVGIIGFAAVSLLSWGEHMTTSGHSIALSAFFALVALLGLVPATHLVGSWLVSLARGTRPDAPLLLALGFVLTFVLGGLSGLFLGVQSVGVHLHGTAFVVGHSHLLLGSVVLSLLGGLHFWWSKLTGTAYSEPHARLGALVTLAGVLGAFLPQLVLGARGLPRRAATYPDELWLLENVSAAGAAVLAIGLGVLVINLLVALRSRQPAPANPWAARGLEWSCPSPPPVENFRVAPHVED